VHWKCTTSCCDSLRSFEGAVSSQLNFEMVLNPGEVSSIAPIGAVSFLWRATEQKDLADSGEPLFKYPSCSASNKN